MRVLHITTEFPPVVYGGLGTAVGGWVTASARGGLTVGVLLVNGSISYDFLESYGASGNLGEHEPTVWESWARKQMTRSQQPIKFFVVSSRLLSESSVSLATLWKPDVVHLHSASLWTAAKTIRDLAGTPILYHVHALDRAEHELSETRTPTTRPSAQEKVIESADRLLALSRSERDLLVAYYPSTRDRVRVIGNGINDIVSAGWARTRRRHSYSPLVLFCGRFVERKGLRDLLDAIPLVLEEAPTTRFVLVGGAGWQTAAEAERTWLPPRLAAYRSQIHFTGWLKSHELENWYRVADILAVPSWYEPFGMVVLEGMLYGLAISASRVGGPAEILKHERTALLFPPRDVSSLAQSLVRLAQDSVLRRTLGVQAAEDVRKNWLWPRMVKAMRRVLEDLSSEGTQAKAKGR